MRQKDGIRELGCVQAATHILGDKWTPLLLRVLASQGAQRFNALTVAASHISPRTLSTRLVKLEKEGIIAKKIFTETPPHTEYTLTEKGYDLIPVLENMAAWGDKHGPSTHTQQAS